MDELDHLLFQAWERIGKKLQADRLNALRRSRRTHGVITRPLRACCLAIRASDTRFNSYHAIIDPHHARDQHQPHLLTISGSLIKRATAPVNIPRPGVDYQTAADMLGREYNTITSWVLSGALHVTHYRQHRRPVIGSPRVWTVGPIDPNHARGRPPHHVWGTLWQHLNERIPDNFTLQVERVPRLRFDRGSVRFSGWYFRCPGRLIRTSAHPNTNDSSAFSHQPCGRRTTYLYAPQPIWTLAQALGDERGFELPPILGLPERWCPGSRESDPIRASGAASFACRACWGVRQQSWADHTGWNEFISHISGGLLYGHDVPRPPHLAPLMRRVAHRPWKANRTGTPRLKPADAFIIAQAKDALRRKAPTSVSTSASAPTHASTRAKPRSNTTGSSRRAPRAPRASRTYNVA